MIFAFRVLEFMLLDDKEKFDPKITVYTQRSTSLDDLCFRVPEFMLLDDKAKI
jgi:hypothetical protein